MKSAQSFSVHILLCVLAFTGLACHPALKSDLPVVQLIIDGNKVSAEVANTESSRMAGLMFRRDMGSDDGMLFVFPDIKQRAFWMKNTLIPLSIAFMDEKGNVENVLEMPPQTEDTFMSAGPAQYALEMNTGWFAKHSVKPGDVVVGAVNAPKGKN